MTVDQTPIIHSDNVVQQLKDSDSESDSRPGPLIGLLMRSLDCFLRSYVLDRQRKILLQNPFQE